MATDRTDNGAGLGTPFALIVAKMPYCRPLRGVVSMAISQRLAEPII